MKASELKKRDAADSKALATALSEGGEATEQLKAGWAKCRLVEPLNEESLLLLHSQLSLAGWRLYLADQVSEAGETARQVRIDNHQGVPECDFGHLSDNNVTFIRGFLDLFNFKPAD